MGEFRMPALGADMEQGVLNEWLVKVGDEVHRGDVVAVVETPKSAVEVECFETGTVEQLIVAVGEKVPVGTVMARLREPAAAATRVTEAMPSQERAVLSRASAAPERSRVTPLARRLAAQLGVDLASVPGSGLGGAVRADDVREAAARAAKAPPAAPPTPRPVHPDGEPAHPSPAPPDRSPQLVRVSPDGQAELATPASESSRAHEMRRSIASLMTVSNREIPHYYLSLTVDIQRVVDLVHERNRDLDMGDRLVPSAFLVAAAARAARTVPELNGHWVEGSFRAAAVVDLGLVLSLRSGGLLVPVIADADHQSVAQVMAAMRELTRRARSGRLRGSDLAPPSITVSNLGDQGVDSVHGVIYPPQVALVGFGAVAERPWAVDGLIGVRPIVTVTLAGDHRATDAATGSRFLRAVDRLLQIPEEL